MKCIFWNYRWRWLRSLQRQTKRRSPAAGCRCLCLDGHSAWLSAQCTWALSPWRHAHPRLSAPSLRRSTWRQGLGIHWWGLWWWEAEGRWPPGRCGRHSSPRLDRLQGEKMLFRERSVSYCHLLDNFSASVRTRRLPEFQVMQKSLTFGIKS